MRTIKLSSPILVLAVSVLLFAFIVLLGLNSAPRAAASVGTGEEYLATTTYAASTAVRTLKAGYGALGQVTITGANTGVMTLYDATTSDVTKRVLATSSLPVIADFPASVAAGTYVFDARFSSGLLLVSSGAVATSSIMYK